MQPGLGIPLHKAMATLPKSCLEVVERSRAILVVDGMADTLYSRDGVLCKPRVSAT